MLLLDDVQWADVQSLELLGRLARQVGGLPLLVVCGARRAPRREAVEQALARTAERGARVLELAPLDAGAATALAAQRAGGEPGANLRARIAACGGNPFYVELLLSALRDAIALDGRGAAEIAAGPLPDSLAATVRDRLRALGSGTVELLALASVLGGEFAVADLAAVSGRPVAELWPPLREALAAGVLSERGERLAFGHDLVREALYDDLPRSVREGLHLDAGRALAAAGADAPTVAEQFLRGARRGDPEVVGWLERAARETAARSAGVAAELLEAALELTAPGAPTRGRIEAELAVTLIAAGRRPEGEALARQSLAQAGWPQAEGALRLALARSLVERGHFVEALGEAATAAASGGVAPRERAEALAWAAMGPLFAHDLDAADAEIARALEVARAAGAAHVTALSLTRAGHVAGFRGDFAGAARLTGEAVAVAVADGSREALHASHAHLNHAMALADADRPLAGLAELAAGRRLYERLGMEETLRNSHHYAGHPLICAGRWEEALAELETAVTLSEEAQIAWTVDVLASRALLQVRRDELEPAREAVAGASAALAAGALEFRLGWTDWARALLAEADGDADGALALLWAAWERATAAGMVCEQRYFAPELVRLLAASTRDDARRDADAAARLEAVAEAIEALAARNADVETIAALALRCRALADGGDADALAAAAERYPRGEGGVGAGAGGSAGVGGAGDAGPRPHERALAQEDAAVALVAAGRREEGAALADAALDRYARLGARRDAARAEGRLRAAGLRRGARGPRGPQGQAPSSGWAALTASERRVADLAAEGLSNPQIAERLVISRHTVATHVSRALAKLGLRSRYELASARPDDDA